MAELLDKCIFLYKKTMKLFSKVAVLLQPLLHSHHSFCETPVAPHPQKHLEL